MYVPVRQPGLTLKLVDRQLVNGYPGTKLKGNGICSSRLGKALYMRHCELNLMSLSFLATPLTNFDPPDSDIG